MAKREAIVLYEFKNDNKSICPIDVIKEGTKLDIYDSNQSGWCRFTLMVNKKDKVKVKGLIPLSFIRFLNGEPYNLILDREFQNFEEFYYLMIKRIDNNDTSNDQTEMIKKFLELNQTKPFDFNFLTKYPLPKDLTATMDYKKYENFNKFIFYLLFKIISVEKINNFPIEWSLGIIEEGFGNIKIEDSFYLTTTITQFLIKLIDSMNDFNGDDIFSLCWTICLDNYSNNEFTGTILNILFDDKLSEYYYRLDQVAYLSARLKKIKFDIPIAFNFTNEFFNHFFKNISKLDPIENYQDKIFKSFKFLMEKLTFSDIEKEGINNNIIEFLKVDDQDQISATILLKYYLTMYKLINGKKTQVELLISIAGKNLYRLFSNHIELFIKAVKPSLVHPNNNELDIFTNIELSILEFVNIDKKWGYLFDNLNYIVGSTLEGDNWKIFNNSQSIFKFLDPTILIDLIDSINNGNHNGGGTNDDGINDGIDYGIDYGIDDSIDSNAGGDISMQDGTTHNLLLHQIGRGYLERFEIKNESDLVQILKLSIKRPNFLKLFSIENQFFEKPLPDSAKQFSLKIITQLLDEESIFIYNISDKLYPELFYLNDKLGFNLRDQVSKVIDDKKEFCSKVFERELKKRTWFIHKNSEIVYFLHAQLLKCSSDIDGEVDHTATAFIQRLLDLHLKPESFKPIRDSLKNLNLTEIREKRVFISDTKNSFLQKSSNIDEIFKQDESPILGDKEKHYKNLETKIIKDFISNETIDLFSKLKNASVTTNSFENFSKQKQMENKYNNFEFFRCLSYYSEHFFDISNNMPHLYKELLDFGASSLDDFQLSKDNSVDYLYEKYQSDLIQKKINLDNIASNNPNIVLNTISKSTKYLKTYSKICLWIFDNIDFSLGNIQTLLEKQKVQQSQQEKEQQLPYEELQKQIQGQLKIHSYLVKRDLMLVQQFYDQILRITLHITNNTKFDFLSILNNRLQSLDEYFLKFSKEGDISDTKSDLGGEKKSSSTPSKSHISSGSSSLHDPPFGYGHNQSMMNIFDPYQNGRLYYPEPSPDQFSANLETK